MAFIAQYWKFIIAGIAALVITFNNGDVVGSIPVIEDISDNLIAWLGAGGVLLKANSYRRQNAH